MGDADAVRFMLRSEIRSASRAKASGYVLKDAGMGALVDRCKEPPGSAA
jgi:hypothetical protein